jgi:putative ABC transport system ATP-binding protein
MLFGASGSGKSTLLGLLGGVLVPQSGSVRVLGNELASMTARERDRFRVDHVGFIFQQFNLVPYLNAVQNVLLPCRFSQRRAERAAQGPGGSISTQAGELLESIGIVRSLWRSAVTDLSVGQQQRVAAARALIGRPELILADEPTSALDADAQQVFLELLHRQCEESGAALLFVTHDRRLSPRFDSEISLAAINEAAV